MSVNAGKFTSRQYLSSLPITPHKHCDGSNAGYPVDDTCTEPAIEVL